MKITHLKPEDYVVSTWSGGTTTQLGIAPQGAVYAHRDFLWRVSSATVDLDVSDFTALPDYDRLISTLEGEIDLTHNGGEALHLAPYGIHRFDGGWQTRSVGRCRDFNLMMRKGECDGRMEAVPVPGQLTVGGRSNDTAILYCGQGQVTVCVGSDTVTLSQGQSLKVESAGDVTLCLSGHGCILLAEAWYD